MSGYDDGGSGTYGYVPENPFEKMALHLLSSFTSYQIQFHGFPANQRVSQIPRNKILSPVRHNPTTLSLNPFEGFEKKICRNQDDQSFGYGNLDLDDTSHPMCDETYDDSLIKTIINTHSVIRNDKSIKSLSNHSKH